MKIYLKNKCDRTGVKVEPPKQANLTDSGFDIISVSEPEIIGESIELPMDGGRLYKRIDFIQYRTNLQFAYENENDYLQIYPRSSITKYNLILKNCVPIIDNGFRDSVLLRFSYVIQPEDLRIIPEYGINRIYCSVNQDKIYQKSNKIAQIIPATRAEVNFELIDKLPDSIRGNSGFGSSDKQIVV